MLLPAPAQRTPPGSAKEGVDLIQQGSSCSHPAPAPHAPPGGARQDIKIGLIIRGDRCREAFPVQWLAPPQVPHQHLRARRKDCGAKCKDHYNSAAVTAYRDVGPILARLTQCNSRAVTLRMSSICLPLALWDLECTDCSMSHNTKGGVSSSVTDN